MRRVFTTVPISGLALLLAAVSSPSCSSDASHMPPGGAGGGSGSGGAGSGNAGMGGSAAIDCTADQALDPTAVIDDMEMPDYMTVRAAGRSGAWWAGGDGASPGASITPNGDAAAEPIPGGRCGSTHAMRVTGQGFTMWAVLSVSMGWGSIDGGAAGLLPNDNHSRTGVTFWARIGDTSSDRVRFAITDKYSRPEGGLCVENGSTDVACYDSFGIDLPQLSTAWKRYQIPFSGLTQRQFGLPRPELDASSIYTVEFQLNPNSVFDFWLDDVAFY
jgi:hypothetical protein